MSSKAEWTIGTDLDLRGSVLRLPVRHQESLPACFDMWCAGDKYSDGYIYDGCNDFILQWWQKEEKA